MLLGKILFYLSIIFVLLFLLFLVIFIVRKVSKKSATVYLVIFILCLIASPVCLISSNVVSEKAYQDDCDIVRLQHLLYYGKLIEEYKEKNGKYPFEGQEMQVYSLIYNEAQKKYCQDTNPYEHILVEPGEFFAELENGLGRQLDQLFDPQYVPTKRPVLYIYMIDGDQYFFAVHLSKNYPFAKKVASGYYKAEISNISEEKYKFHTVEELENDEAYQKASMGTLGGYFDLRKKQHIREYE
ncbi:MAG: hypothetical protein K5839_05650 [Treponemataceae bacterium]|nr:hypothetical protein [Treponemataceae bacterium]